jgi:hypothetical protein
LFLLLFLFVVVVFVAALVCCCSFLWCFSSLMLLLAVVACLLLLLSRYLSNNSNQPNNFVNQDLTFRSPESYCLFTLREHNSFISKTADTERGSYGNHSRKNRIAD